MENMKRTLKILTAAIPLLKTEWSILRQHMATDWWQIFRGLAPGNSFQLQSSFNQASHFSQQSFSIIVRSIPVSQSTWAVPFQDRFTADQHAVSRFWSDCWAWNLNLRSRFQVSRPACLSPSALKSEAYVALMFSFKMMNLNSTDCL